MLKTTDKKQEEHIESMLSERIGVIDISDSGVYIDDFITYDQMAEIVDYLRTLAPRKELFEECWVMYRRKGSKKKSLEQWKKLTDKEKDLVLPHIKAYISVRDTKYQQDFERYLRDRTFNNVVFDGNAVIYDPTKIGNGKKQDEVYMPMCGGALNWNDYYNTYLYVGMWFGHIPDGYTDDNRPDGATVMLNNGQGTVCWSRERKAWDLVKV